MTYKLNKKQIAFFKKEVLKYVGLFGLGRWSIKFVDTVDDSAPSGLAAVKFVVWNRSAKFWINPEQKSNPSKNMLSKMAVHEVAHLLTARLFDYSMSRFVSEDEIDEEFEAIAKSIENALFGVEDK